jgi:hypothetical protein
MNKAGKIFLYMFSCLPLMWTATILIGAYYFSGTGTESIFGHMERALVSKSDFISFKLPIFYFLLCTPFYSALLTYLTFKKKITLRQLTINISLALIGLLAGYLSIHFDILSVWSRYIAV